MTLIHLLALIAGLIACASVVRLGNRALREQRIGRMRRRRKEMTVEGATGREVETALRDLKLWREQGYPRATEVSWERLLKLISKHPEVAIDLRMIVQDNIALSKHRPSRAVPYVSIKLADEDSAELRRGTETARKKTPEDTLMVQTPLLAP